MTKKYFAKHDMVHLARKENTNKNQVTAKQGLKQICHAHRKKTITFIIICLRSYDPRSQYNFTPISVGNTFYLTFGFSPLY